MKSFTRSLLSYGFVLGVGLSLTLSAATPTEINLWQSAPNGSRCEVGSTDGQPAFHCSDGSVVFCPLLPVILSVRGVGNSVTMKMSDLTTFGRNDHLACIYVRSALAFDVIVPSASACPATASAVVWPPAGWMGTAPRGEREAVSTKLTAPPRRSELGDFVCHYEQE